MKKENLAKEYSKNKSSSNVFKENHEKDFLAGYNKALEYVLELIDRQQKNYIDLSKKDKTKKQGVEAILTATTLLKVEIKKD